jgi:hypothetical protein
MTKPRFICGFSLVWALIFGSCIGLKADMTLRGDGSGRLILEYRVSRIAESLGKLDGNERWQTVPAGRADFDRTVERLPGVRLVSFSAKDDGADVINRVSLEFKDIESLIPFLAGAGESASLTEENGNRRLSLIFSPGAKNADPELLALIREASRPYALALNFSAPGEAALALTDGGGNPLAAPPEGLEIQSRGKKVSLSIGTGDLLSLPEGLGVEITWPAAASKR